VWSIRSARLRPDVALVVGAPARGANRGRVGAPMPVRCPPLAVLVGSFRRRRTQSGQEVVHDGQRVVAHDHAAVGFPLGGVVTDFERKASNSALSISSGSSPKHVRPNVRHFGQPFVRRAAAWTLPAPSQPVPRSD
jgi:hypothetical protein